MPRSRQFIALFTLLALVAITIGVVGVDLPFLRPSGATSGQPRSGVRAVNATTLVRVGNGVPPGSDLAFLAVEPSGNLVATDRARKSVLRFDASGHLLSEWGPRLGEFSLVEPAGVAVDGDAYYVLDRGSPRVFRLDGNGRLQNSFSLEAQGTYGLNGLAVDPDGNLYLADTGRNRILVYSPTGTLLRQFGHQGTGLGEFTQPMAVAFLPDRSFVVADWENSRLERWDRTFTATDAWPTGFHAFGVAADQDGHVFAPDAERRRIGVYSPTGELLTEFGGSGSIGIDVAPRQLAIGQAQPKSLYALGGDGIVRIDLDTVPLPPANSDVDVVSPIVVALLLALPVVALVLRRGRRARSLAPTTNGEVRLHAENGAQRQQQQPYANEDLLVAHQPEREDQARNQDHEPIRDRQSGHRD